MFDAVSNVAIGSAGVVELPFSDQVVYVSASVGPL